MKKGRHIFLIGFMGCGKSYWGERLAADLKCPFLDLDGLIGENVGLSIPEIFARKGESGFRQLEQEALHQLSERSLSVIATGGGTPCFFDNMDWMNQHGVSIYLKVSAVTLANRLQHKAENRPLLAGIQTIDLQSFIISKIAERTPFYSQARAVLEDEQDDEPRFLEKLRALLSDLGELI